MRKPETFDELCESLTKPYSTAKQYFDAVILEFDVYGDSQYFYEKRCSEHETQYNNLKKLTMLNVIVCFVISVVSSFFMIYIVGLIGINTFVDFVNDNIIQLVIGGIASIIASIVVYYKNFYKKL